MCININAFFIGDLWIRWTAEDDQIVNFPTVRMKRGMPVRVKTRRRKTEEEEEEEDELQRAS